jgi:cytochrome c biogenesis protein ResB
MRKGKTMSKHPLPFSWAVFRYHIVHLSVFLILAGAVYGHYSKIKKEIALPVGGSCKLEFASRTVTLRLNDFSVNYYPDGTVSDWISDVSLEENGHKLLRKKIRVNHPLHYRGIQICQISFAPMVPLQMQNGSGFYLRSILQIKQDPGLPLVWAGFYILVPSFFISLYTRLYLTAISRRNRTVHKNRGIA